MAGERGLREVGRGSSAPEVGDRRLWLGVEFRHLGALAAVAREGSFRRAAESLGYVQSAISGQIAQLERVVGTQLVERSSGSGGAELTAAGRVLLEHVDAILARFDAARMDVHAIAAGTDVAVRIGVLEEVGPRRLPTILRVFSSEFPHARVTIQETGSGEADFEGLSSGALDLIITELPLPDGPFAYVLLERDPYVLLVPADSPLSKQTGPPDLAQLSGVRVLVAASRDDQEKTVAGLRDSGIDWRPWLRTSGIGALQAIVGARLGVALVPALAVDPHDPSTVVVEAPELLPDRSIVLVKHREREYSEIAQAFIRIVETEFGDRHSRLRPV
jgi:molybdate transport repressor ModE-like protein